MVWAHATSQKPWPGAQALQPKVPETLFEKSIPGPKTAPQGNPTNRYWEPLGHPRGSGRQGSLYNQDLGIV